MDAGIKDSRIIILACAEAEQITGRMEFKGASQVIYRPSIQTPWHMAQARKRFMGYAIIPMMFIGDYLRTWNEVYGN